MINNKPTILILFLLSLITFGQTKVIQELDNDLLVIEKNKKFAVSKDTLNPDFKFDTIYKSSREDYLFTKVNNHWGIIDQNGKIIIPNLYDNIYTACCYENLNGKDNFIVRKQNKVGIVKYNNKILIPILYDKITSWVEYGPNAHYVSKDNKIGLIKHNGKIMIPVVYDSLYYETDKIIKGKLNEKFGVLNSKNKIIIPFEYDALIVDFNTHNWEIENHIDKFVVKKNNLWFYIDYNGNIIRENISNEEIQKKFAPFELNNYDFEYIGKLLH